MKGHLKKSLILILLIFISQLIHSQDSSFTKLEKIKITNPNIIKINTISLPFKNIALTYERGIKPNLSAEIGVNYKYGGFAPKILSINSSEIGLNMDDVKGVTITPEIKYYIKTCDPTLLEGFYIGAYLRYTRYKTGIDFTYTVPSQATAEYSADIGMREMGVGIKLGYQLLIKKRFVMDFLFFGPRFSTYKFGYEFKEGPSQEFYDDLSEYLNNVIDRFGGDYNVNIKKSGEGKASTSFSFVNMRFGLSLGYSF